MYSVEIDRGKRLLVISAVGRVTRDEVKSAAQQVRDKVKDVLPGLRVLTDFRWMESMESAAARHVAAIMDALAEKGAALVVRIMPDPHKDIGLNILSQFHYGAEIQLATVETLAEALLRLMEEGTRALGVLPPKRWQHLLSRDENAHRHSNLTA